MSRFERWVLHFGLLTSLVTGVGLGVVRYFGVVDGEFGPEPSPALPLWQHAHVLLVPLLVFGLGLAVAGHARAYFKGRQPFGRRSGLVLGVLAVPLVFGGAAVQVITAATGRTWAGYAHAGVGAIFAAVFLLHWAKRVWVRNARRRSSPELPNQPGVVSNPSTGR